jgi:hypothetical protein
MPRIYSVERLTRDVAVLFFVVKLNNLKANICHSFSIVFPLRTE